MAWWLEYYRDWAPDAEASLDDTTASAEVAFVENALKLSPQATVLDIGCGYGRHLIHLASRGFTVTGVDACPELLQRAKASAQRCDLHVDLVEADMRELPFRAQFDAAICMRGTFGSLGDAGDRAALAAAARALKSGGTLLVDVANAWYDIAKLVNSDNRFVDWSVHNGVYRLVEATFDVRTCMGRFRKAVLDAKGLRESHQEWRAYTYPEFCQMLRETGLAAKAEYGGLDGTEFTACSPQMVVVAAKS